MSAEFVDIYTDGSCLGNPGCGGWAAILVYKGHEKIISGSEEHSTNNRMELTAVIRALSTLKRDVECNVYIDSAYVMGAYEHNWMRSWKKNNWRNSANKEVANKELWQQLDELCSKFKVKFYKVKGHSGHEYNERCDKLAVEESKKRQASLKNN